MVNIKQSGIVISYNTKQAIICWDVYIW